MDIPLRIAQTEPSSINYDGVLGTVSPDSADMLSPVILSQIANGELVVPIDNAQIAKALIDVAATTAIFNYGPPEQPSDPILQGIPAGIEATWDGLNADGTTARPQDFHHLEVHMSTVNSFVPDDSTLVASIVASQGNDELGTLPKGGGCVIPSTDYTHTQYVRFIAVTVSGQRSIPSGQSSATPLQIRDLDVQRFGLTVTSFQSLKHFLY